MIEPGESDHSRHVTDTVKQIAPLANVELMSTASNKAQDINASFKVVNASFGTSDPNYPHLIAALNGSLLIKTSGNESSSLTKKCPASAPFGSRDGICADTYEFLQNVVNQHKNDFERGMILVGSVNPGNLPSDFSNYPGGNKEFQDHFIWALGSDVLANVETGPMRMSGTSMAAPIVTGVAVLIAGKYPDFDRSEIKQCILGSARDDFFVEDPEERILVHVSPKITKASIDATKDDYLRLDQPYKPEVWGKGILDVKRALLYGETYQKSYTQKKAADPTLTHENIKKNIDHTQIKKSVDEKSRSQEGDMATKIQAHIRGLLAKKKEKSSASERKRVEDRPILQSPWWKSTENEKMEKHLKFAINGHFNSIWRLMLDKKMKNKTGLYPLHFAVLLQKPELVKDLLGAPGIDVNQANKDGTTPLHYAARRGEPEVVQILLRAPEIDVNKANEFEETPLHYPAEQGNTEVVQILLGATEIDVNKVELYGGETPLHYAAEQGKSEVVKALLNAQGIDVNLADKWTRTPLEIAVEKGHTAIVTLLENFIKEHPKVAQKTGS